MFAREDPAGTALVVCSIYRRCALTPGASKQHVPSASELHDKGPSVPHDVVSRSWSLRVLGALNAEAMPANARISAGLKRSIVQRETGGDEAKRVELYI